MRTMILFASLLVTGCLSRPIEARYFDPSLPEAPCDPAQVASRPVRLGHITAAPYLRDRIVWRLSENEVAFDEMNRWAAPPEMLLEDALSRYLVARNGFQRSDSASACTVSVHVVAFEVERPAKDVLVRVLVTLRDPSGEAQRGAFEARQPAAIDDPRSVAQAAGIALSDVVRRLGDWLRQSLA